jgi:hypothetical protein
MEVCVHSSLGEIVETSNCLPDVLCKLAIKPEYARSGRESGQTILDSKCQLLPGLATENMRRGFALLWNGKEALPEICCALIVN